MTDGLGLLTWSVKWILVLLLLVIEVNEADVVGLGLVNTEEVGTHGLHPDHPELLLDQVLVPLWLQIVVLDDLVEVLGDHLLGLLSDDFPRDAAVSQ